VDGFRVDASAVLTHDHLLRDDPPNPDANADTPPPQRLKRIFTDDRREVLGCLEEIRGVVDEFEDRVLLGEVQGKTDRIGHFYGNHRPRLHLPLNFALLDSAWDALSLQGTLDAYLNAIPEDAWPNWTIGGHDKRRVTSKIGQAQARILGMLIMTLQGTPILFAGDELGMEQVTIPPDRVQDPFEKLVPGYGLNRDPQRAPMRWDATANAGFTSGEPWLPLGEDVAARNAATLQSDERSLLWLYRRLIAVRRAEPALTLGRYVPIRSRYDVLLFKRVWEEDEILVALNTVHEPRKLEWSQPGTVLLSTTLTGDGGTLRGPTILGADQGLIIKLRPDE
jgi:alpha-glucosidase